VKKRNKEPASEDKILAFRKAVLELDEDEERLKQALQSLAKDKPQLRED
jgi:hypothetical protein